MANDEWYTPPAVIAPVRKVLGVIDLDPASCAEAQARVKATRFFTKEQDGLSQPWEGRVWLNPPYSRGVIGKFVDKLLAELASGRVTAAIMLTNNCSDTEWFAKASRAATAICFPLGRIKFLTSTGKAVGSPRISQAVFFFGVDPGPFLHEFRHLGLIGKLSKRRTRPSRSRRPGHTLASTRVTSDQKQSMGSNRSCSIRAKRKKHATSNRTKRHKSRPTMRTSSATATGARRGFCRAS